MKQLLMIFFSVLSIPILNFANMSWSSPPVTISSPGVNATSAQIASDPNGNVTAIWLEGGNVQVSSKPLGGGWNGITTLASSSTSPQIAIDGSGNVYAVWAVTNTGSIQTAYLPHGGSWGSAVTLSTGTGNAEPRIAVDSSGNAVALWLNGSDQISAAIQKAGQAWPSTPTLVTTQSSDSPQVAIGNGLVVAVWQGPYSLPNTIYASTLLLSSGTWTSPQVISNPGFSCENPQIIIDSFGNATAGWFRYQVSGTQYSNVVAQEVNLPFNGSWSTPVDVSSPGIMDPTKLIAHAAVDAQGNIMALGTQSYDGATIWSGWITKLYGGSWTSPLAFVGDNPYSYDSGIAFAAPGIVVAAWMYYDSMSSILSIQAADMDVGTGGRWNFPSTLSNQNTNSYPRVAASSSGSTLNAVAVWVAWNGTNSIIQSATGTGQIVQPPTNLAVSQSQNNFNLFTELYNTFSWQASPSPNVVGYHVYRNGILVATLPGAQLEFIDNNRSAGQSITYSISAYDQFYSESAQVSIAGP